jgi:hypothetical protein
MMVISRPSELYFSAFLSFLRSIAVVVDSNALCNLKLVIGLALDHVIEGSRRAATFFSSVFIQMLPDNGA